MEKLETISDRGILTYAYCEVQYRITEAEKRLNMTDYREIERNIIRKLKEQAREINSRLQQT